MPESTITEQRGLRLLLLRGQSVYTYRDYFELPLDEQGLVYVTGRNLDTQEPSSSGAGKSRLFSLIPRALYGRESLGKSEPVGAIWPADGSGGFYELIYWSDGTYYKVREEAGRRAASSLSFYKNSSLSDDTWEAIGAKNKKGALQSEISASTNRPLDEFLGTVVWKQGHGHVLIQGTPSERIAWLSSLFGLTKYDLIHAELDAKYTELKAKQQDYLPFVGAYAQAKQAFDNLGSIESLQKDVSSTTAQILSLKEQESQFRDANARASDVLAATKLSWQTRAQFTSFGVPFDTGVADARLDTATVQSLLDTANTEKAKLEKLLEDFNAAKPVLLSYRELPSEIKQDLLDPTLISSLATKLASLRTGLSSAESKIETTKQVIERREQLTTRLRSLYPALISVGVAADVLKSSSVFSVYLQGLQDQQTKCGQDLAVCDSKVQEFTALSKLGGSCPTCGNVVDAAHVAIELSKIQPRLAAYKQEQQRLASILANARVYLSCLSEFEVAPSASKDELSSLVALLSEQKETLAALEKRYSSLVSAQDVALRYSALSSDVVTLDVPSAQARLTEHASLVSSLTDRQRRNYQILSFEGKDFTKTEEDVLQARENVATTQEALESVQIAIADATSSLRLQQHKIEQITLAKVELDRLETLNNEYQDLVRRTDLARDTRSAYDKKGFKKARLRQLLELIREKLPVWTGILFTERNFFVDVSGDEDQLSLVAHQLSDPANDGSLVEKVYDVAELSGGEESKLAICVMLTLIDIVAEERKCNIAILDEVDRHMDKNALTLMSNHLIRNLAERRSSIYFVSHQIPLSSDFDKELVVTKQRACSSLAIKNLRAS